METAFLQWVTEHGYPALFCLLALGIVGAPIPDETLLVAAGAMVAQNRMHPAPTLAAVFAGSAIGITVSYGIGRFADAWLAAGQGGWRKRLSDRIERGSERFRAHGPVILFGGYFLPGIRHLIGIAAGALHVPYRTFCFYAYGGAFVWAIAFLAIGWFAGEEWRRVARLVRWHFRILEPVLLLAGIAYVVLWLRSRRDSTSG